MGGFKHFFLAVLLSSISFSEAVPTHTKETQNNAPGRAKIVPPLDSLSLSFAPPCRRTTVLLANTTGTVPSTITPPSDTTVPPSSAPISQHTHTRGGGATWRSSAIVATIFLAVLFLIGGLLGLVRFLCSFWRTPRHDRAAAALDRQRVAREVMYAEQELAFGGEGLMAPPPPYLSRPPSYVYSDASPVKEGFADSPGGLRSPGIYVESLHRDGGGCGTRALI
ncbi:hypothetical protein DFH09DRAFT_203298 [Mycena vulgaris]|nr:hypothetical protein DFH09DRAFT_203298 [Mycena vulgaris]